VVLNNVLLKVFSKHSAVIISAGISFHDTALEYLKGILNALKLLILLTYIAALISYMVPLNPLLTFQIVLKDKREWSTDLVSTFFLTCWCCVNCLHKSAVYTACTNLQHLLLTLHQVMCQHNSH